MNPKHWYPADWQTTHRLYWYGISDLTPEDQLIMQKGGIWMLDQEIAADRERKGTEYADYEIMRKAAGMCDILRERPDIRRRIIKTWALAEVAKW